MEVFSFASALDLNKGYYNIKLDADAQKICIIVFPCSRYKEKVLLLGIKITWILMGHKTSLSLSKKWNMIRQAYYLDDLLILINSSFKDHPLKLEMVLARLSTNELLV
jgi:hypothetical protein